jgi:hypothetical protein
MLNHPIRLYTELTVVAIGPSDETHSLDLLDRKLLNITRAN